VKVKNIIFIFFTVINGTHMLTILKRMNDNGILAYAKSIPED